MEEAIVLTYDISADDFTRAGEASSDVKRKLKQMGVSPDAIRKVAIAMYEGLSTVNIAAGTTKPLFPASGNPAISFPTVYAPVRWSQNGGARRPRTSETVGKALGE